MERDNSRVQRLHRNIQLFIDEARKRGFNTGLAEGTAIVPVVIGSDDDAFTLSMRMQAGGVILPPAVYPAVPKN